MLIPGGEKEEELVGEDLNRRVDRGGDPQKKHPQQGSKQGRNQGSWQKHRTMPVSVRNLNLQLKNDHNNMQIMVIEPKEV